MKFSDAKIALVGATGLVGRHILQVMEERRLNPSKFVLFASEKSVGGEVGFLGTSYKLEPLIKDYTGGFDIAFFAAGAKVSLEWAPVFVNGGAKVIDKSSAWRVDPDCPLIVPQINPHALDNIPKGIIASPNCTTIGFVLALKPLINAFNEPEHIFAATYQAVSGAGKDGTDALHQQRLGKDYAGPFKKPILDNVLPSIGSLGPCGFYQEESKLIIESRKILGISTLDISATAVRVPVVNGHSLVVTIIFRDEVDVNKAAETIASAPAIRFIDDNDYPTPLEASGQDDVLVGRLRTIPGNSRALSLFLTFDNVRRGAATNAIEIAEIIVEKMSD